MNYLLLYLWLLKLLLISIVWSFQVKIFSLNIWLEFSWLLLSISYLFYFFLVNLLSFVSGISINSIELMLLSLLPRPRRRKKNVGFGRGPRFNRRRKAHKKRTYDKMVGRLSESKVIRSMLEEVLESDNDEYEINPTKLDDLLKTFDKGNTDLILRRKSSTDRLQIDSENIDSETSIDSEDSEISTSLIEPVIDFESDDKVEWESGNTIISPTIAKYIYELLGCGSQPRKIYKRMKKSDLEKERDKIFQSLQRVLFRVLWSSFKIELVQAFNLESSVIEYVTLPDKTKLTNWQKQEVNLKAEGELYSMCLARGEKTLQEYDLIPYAERTKKDNKAMAALRKELDSLKEAFTSDLIGKKAAGIVGHRSSDLSLIKPPSGWSEREYHYIPLSRTLLISLIEHAVAIELSSVLKSEYEFKSIIILFDTLVRMEIKRLLSIQSVWLKNHFQEDLLRMSRSLTDDFVNDFLLSNPNGNLFDITFTKVCDSIVGALSFKSTLSESEFFKCIKKFGIELRMRNKEEYLMTNEEISLIILVMGMCRKNLYYQEIGENEYFDTAEYLENHFVSLWFDTLESNVKKDSYKYNKLVREIRVNIREVFEKLEVLYSNRIYLFVDAYNIDNRSFKSLQFDKIVYKEGIKPKSSYWNNKLKSLVYSRMKRSYRVVSSLNYSDFMAKANQYYPKSRNLYLQGSRRDGLVVNYKYSSILRDYFLLEVIKGNEIISDKIIGSSLTYNRTSEFNLLLDNRGRMYYSGIISPSYSRLCREYIEMLEWDIDGKVYNSLETIPSTHKEIIRKEFKTHADWDVSASMWTIMLGLLGRWAEVEKIINGELDMHNVCRCSILSELPKNHPWYRIFNRDMYKTLASPLIYGSILDKGGRDHFRSMYEEYMDILPELTNEEIKQFQSAVTSGISKIIDLEALRKAIMCEFTPSNRKELPQFYPTKLSWQNHIFSIELPYDSEKKLRNGSLPNFIHSIDACVLWKVLDLLSDRLCYAVHDSFYTSSDLHDSVESMDYFLYHEVPTVYLGCLKRVINSIKHTDGSSTKRWVKSLSWNYTRQRVESMVRKTNSFNFPVRVLPWSQRLDDFFQFWKYNLKVLSDPRVKENHVKTQLSNFRYWSDLNGFSFAMEGSFYRVIEDALIEIILVKKQQSEGKKSTRTSLKRSWVDHDLVKLFDSKTTIHKMGDCSLFPYIPYDLHEELFSDVIGWFHVDGIEIIKNVRKEKTLKIFRGLVQEYIADRIFFGDNAAREEVELFIEGLERDILKHGYSIEKSSNIQELKDLIESYRVEYLLQTSSSIKSKLVIKKLTAEEFKGLTKASEEIFWKEQWCYSSIQEYVEKLVIKFNADLKTKDLLLTQAVFNEFKSTYEGNKLRRFMNCLVLNHMMDAMLPKREVIKDTLWGKLLFLNVYNVREGIVGIGHTTEEDNKGVNYLLDMRYVSEKDIESIITRHGKLCKMNSLFPDQRGYMGTCLQFNSLDESTTIRYSRLRDLSAYLKAKYVNGKYVSFSDSEKSSIDPAYSMYIVIRAEGAKLTSDNDQWLNPSCSLELRKISRYIFSLSRADAPLKPTKDKSSVSPSSELVKVSSSDVCSVDKDSSPSIKTLENSSDISLVEKVEEAILLETKEEVNIPVNYSLIEAADSESSRFGFEDGYVVTCKNKKVRKYNFVLCTADIETLESRCEDSGLRVLRPTMISYYNEIVRLDEMELILKKLNLSVGIDYLIEKNTSLYDRKDISSRPMTSRGESSFGIVFIGRLCIVNYLKYIILETSYIYGYGQELKDKLIEGIDRRLANCNSYEVEGLLKARDKILCRTEKLPRFVYFHNGSNFDFGYVIEAILILKSEGELELLNSIKVNLTELLNWRTIWRKGQMISISLPSISLEFRDSIRLLSSSLENCIGNFLGEARWARAHKQKIKNYIGYDWEDIDFSQYVMDLSEYCMLDSIKLFEVLFVFNSLIMEVSNISLVTANTISSISFKAWKSGLSKEYVYDPKENTTRFIEAPNSLKDEYFRESYKGGIVDFNQRVALANSWFKGCKGGINFSLIYGNSELFFNDDEYSLMGLDIVSSYPTSKTFNEYGLSNPIKTQKFMYNKVGIYKVRVTIPKTISNKGYSYSRESIGIISLRRSETCWDYVDTLTSYEIKYMHNNGYKFQILSGYYYENSSKELFKGYIAKWFEIKRAAKASKNKSLEVVSKLFLNGLYGMFGLNPASEMLVDLRENELKYYKDFIKILREESRSLLRVLGEGRSGSLIESKIKLPKYLDENISENLVVFDEYVYHKFDEFLVRSGVFVIDSEGTRDSSNHLRVLNPLVLQKKNIANVAIASITTSLSRIMLMKVMNNSAISFIYSDTDSAYFKIRKKDVWNMPKIVGITMGKELGNWDYILSENEEIIGLVVLSSKQYSLLIHDKTTNFIKTYTRNKGSFSVEETWSSFEEFSNSYLQACTRLFELSKRKVVEKGMLVQGFNFDKLNPSSERIKELNRRLDEITFEKEMFYPSFIGMLLSLTFKEECYIGTIEDNCLSKYGLLKQTKVRNWSVGSLVSPRLFISYNQSRLFTVDEVRNIGIEKPIILDVEEERFSSSFDNEYINEKERGIHLTFDKFLSKESEINMIELMNFLKGYSKQIVYRDYYGRVIKGYLSSFYKEPFGYLMPSCGRMQLACMPEESLRNCDGSNNKSPLFSSMHKERLAAASLSKSEVVNKNISENSEYTIINISKEFSKPYTQHLDYSSESIQETSSIKYLSIEEKRRLMPAAEMQVEYNENMKEFLAWREVYYRENATKLEEYEQLNREAYEGEKRREWYYTKLDKIKELKRQQAKEIQRKEIQRKEKIESQQPEEVSNGDKTFSNDTQPQSESGKGDVIKANIKPHSAGSCKSFRCKSFSSRENIGSEEVDINYDKSRIKDRNYKEVQRDKSKVETSPSTHSRALQIPKLLNVNSCAKDLSSVEILNLSVENTFCEWKGNSLPRAVQSDTNVNMKYQYKAIRANVLPKTSNFKRRLNQSQQQQVFPDYTDIIVSYKSILHSNLSLEGRSIFYNYSASKKSNLSCSSVIRIEDIILNTLSCYSVFSQSYAVSMHAWWVASKLLYIFTKFSKNLQKQIIRSVNVYNKYFVVFYSRSPPPPPPTRIGKYIEFLKTIF